MPSTHVARRLPRFKHQEVESDASCLHIALALSLSIITGVAKTNAVVFRNPLRPRPDPLDVKKHPKKTLRDEYVGMSNTS